MSALNCWNIKIHVSGLQVSWLFLNGESRRSAMKGHRLADEFDDMFFQRVAPVATENNTCSHEQLVGGPGPPL